MKHSFYPLIWVCILIASQSFAQNLLINREWVAHTGQPDVVNFPGSQWDEINWTSSTTDFGGNLIVTGNTLVAPGNTDILTTKYNDSGAVVWQITYNGAGNSYDYGMATTTDPQGNIYVAGASSGQSSLLDIVVLKYSPSGVLLWAQTWNGAANLYDIPTVIKTDGAGKIFVAGGSLSLTTQVDFVLLAIDASSGVIGWSKTYDYAGQNEIALNITLGTGSVDVEGFSGSGPGIWDYATVQYATGSGALLNQNRVNIPGIDLNEIFTVANDLDGNIAVSGVVDGGNGNKNAQIVKIDAGFGVSWIQNFDAYGLTDIPRSMTFDPSGNLAVAFESEKPGGGSDIFVLKYDGSGNALWKAPLISPKVNGTAQPGRIKADNNGWFYLAGSIESDNGLDMIFAAIDATGKIRGHRTLDGSANSDDLGTDLNVLTGGNVFVSGKTSQSEGQKYTTIKYSILQKPGGLVFESDPEVPDHFNDQLIVNFSPELVNTDFVNNRELEFADLQEVIDSSLYQSILTLLDGKVAVSRISAVKIFSRMTTDVTTSITRLGEVIPVPKFWSTLLLLLPPGSDENEVIALLETLHPSIEYAHANHCFKPTAIPNDPLFPTDQESLFPSNNAFPDADINVEPAWDIEVGQTNVKVGVYDEAIFWAHEDFGDGTFAGSKIAGGWDFNNSIPIQDVDHPVTSHGTAVGGIIGALRNNGGQDRVGGIAGIAGGDVQAGNTGVQLFSMRIFEGDAYAGDDIVAKAIIEGATSDLDGDDYGYGFHLMNHSWGGGSSDPTIERAVYFCFRNQVIFVASRGNDGVNDDNFPASYNDDWVISVGASGTDGQYKRLNNGDILPSTGMSWWESNFGGNVDLIAPGVTEVVTSTIDATVPFDWTDPFDPNGASICDVEANETEYQCFNGTSASAPHVTGVASLMYSLHNTGNLFTHNLAPEDIEFVLQESAVDVVNQQLGYGVGYDEFNGWGLLEANTSVIRVSPPAWCVFHNGAPINTQVTPGALQQISLPQGIGGLAAGNYWARRNTVTHTYTDVFGSSTAIHEGWRRFSSTIGYSAANPVVDRMWEDVDINIVAPNVATITATTHTWWVETSILGQQINQWLPAAPADLRTAYSLHLQNCSAWLPTTETALDDFIEISPNPTTGIFSVQLKGDRGFDNLTISVFNTSGVEVLSGANLADRNSVELDLASTPPGIYYVRVSSQTGNLVRKIVKF
ncbi:MAG: hypothetical protein EPGJADBJ_04982 [Saprospiraceae bacterium]|nr:hypothetical protein [Saprospiraceae bacterium]